MAPQFDPNTLPSPNPKLLGLTELFVAFLRQHYGDINNIEDPDLAKPGTEYLWTPGRDTQLVIDSMTLYDPQKLNNRPAIYVKRERWNNMRPGIDNRMQGSLPLDGSIAYADYWHGTHTVLCIANETAEIEKFACETYRELNQFGPALRKYAELKRFSVLAIPGFTKLEESGEHWAIPITLEYVVEESWKTNVATVANQIAVTLQQGA